ncbi:MAG: hypothetical protein QM478_05660 [Flavobacteriaceae bacterium]
MALVKQNIFKIKGKIAGISFYKINGKDVVRKSYGPTAQIIKTNPNYSSIKNNNKEFAGATQLSKTIREGLGNIGKEFQDAYMASRLTGVCRTVISNGKGNFGEREADLKTNQDKIIGFPLIKNIPIKNLFKAPYSLQYSDNQKQLRISFPNINKSDFLKFKSYETHFKITMITVCISPYQYSKTQGKYLPKYKNSNGISASSSTELLTINQSHKAIKLSIDISNMSHVISKSATLIWLGVSTYSNLSKTKLSHATQKVMQCIAVT